MNHQKNTVSFLVIVIMTLSYAVSSAGDDRFDWGKISEEEWAMGAPDDYPEANAVVIFDRGEHLVGRDLINFTRHVRIKILTEAGIKEVGDLSFDYYKDDKIKGLEAHTLIRDGEKFKVEEKFEKSYGNWRSMSFAFPMLEPGCIIEFKYENRNKRWVTIDPWFFQGPIYTHYSEYKLILEEGFTYSSATVNLPSYQAHPKVERIMDWRNPRDPKLLEHVWIVENLPPIKDEPYMSFPESYMASLYNQIVSFETRYGYYPYVKGWADLGKEFIDNFLKDFMKKDGGVEEITDSLIAGIDDPLERATAIYKFVQNEIETRKDETHKFIAHDKLNEVLELKFANGSEKNLLLTKMCEYAGLDAWPVLIGNREENLFMPEMYHLRQFDRIISMINLNNTYYFLDTRSKLGRFGILPPSSRMSGGLCLDPNEPYLVRLILDNPDTRRVDRNVFVIEPDGNVTCSTEVEFCGYFAMEYGEDLEEKGREDFMKECFLDEINAPCTHNDLVVERRENGDMKMHFDYVVDDFVRKLDDLYIVNPIRFAYNENPFKSKERYFPVDFGYPFYYRNTCEIILPEGLAPEELPEPLETVINGAGFAQNCVYDGSKIIINSSFKVEKPIFIKEAYKSIQDLFDVMASSAEDQIVVSSVAANE